MYITQRIILALLICSCASTASAQVIIDIEIKGVDKPLEDNIRLFLSINQQKDHALMTEGRLRRLHKNHHRK